MSERYELRYGRWILEERVKAKKKPYIRIGGWRILKGN